VNSISRRRALQRLSVTAALLAAGRLRSAETLPPPRTEPARLSGDPFTLGVASGQPRPDGVILWTRLAPRPHDAGGGLDARPLRVQWQVSEDAGFAAVVQSGEVIARPETAHCVHVPVTGLRSDWRYHYRFRCGDAFSPVGRTRTAPAADSLPARLRLALASCQHYEQGHFTVHREIAAEDFDLVLFVGDYIYDSSNPNFIRRPHEGPQPVTLTQFRARHATYKLDRDLQAAHAAHPWVLAWDDHEVRNDYAAAFGNGDLSADEFVALRAAAYQAYFEHLPLALDQLPGPSGMRMHDRHAWGRLVDLWTLDGRQHRSLQACNDADEDGKSGGRLLWRCDEFSDPTRTVFGPAQERWLHQGLVDSPARWQLLGQGTQMSASGLGNADQRLVFTDGWDGYPAARTRLLQHVADAGIANVVALGGDVHRHVAANLRLRPNDPTSPVVASEFTTTSLTTRGLGEAWMSLIRSSNGDILHARSEDRGYARVEIGYESLHWTARATDFPVAPTSQLHTQASYTVEAGRPGPQAS
jgi:alkaline phosphatase D